VNTSAPIIVHVVVRGQVQGVGYRAFVEDEALRLGLEGWVRNRRDGTVEALLAGSAAALAEMIAACREGPWAARVSGIDERAGGADELALKRPGELFSVLATV